MGLDLSFRKAMNSFTKVESRNSTIEISLLPVGIRLSLVRPEFLSMGWIEERCAESS